jgi:hypothetical protein
MKEFSKDVYGLLEASYSPIDRRGAGTILLNAPLSTIFTIPKGGHSLAWRIALSTRKMTFITPLSPPLSFLKWCE